MSKIAKIVYAFVIIALVVKPFLIPNNPSFISEALARSLSNLFLLALAYFFYSLHKQDVKKKEREKKTIKEKLEISAKKLNEAFKYIGLVNRRLPLLEKLTSGILIKSEDSKQSKKDIFEILLANAVTSIARADWGIFRFIEVKSQKTLKEFSYTEKNYILLKTQISNRELMRLRGKRPVLKRSKNLNYIFASDYSSEIQCVLIFPEGKRKVETEISVLQSITDQAKLFYTYFY